MSLLQEQIKVLPQDIELLCKFSGSIQLVSQPWRVVYSTVEFFADEKEWIAYQLTQLLSRDFTVPAKDEIRKTAEKLLRNK